MNGPFGVDWACARGMPRAAGIWRAARCTKMVGWPGMWKTVGSPAWQLIPSTAWPVAEAAVPASPVPASTGPAGTGTASAPSGPGDGADLSVPSVPSAARWSEGVEGPPGFGLPPVTPSVMPTAAPMTTMAAPAQASHCRRRRRLASSARIRAIFSRARCCLSRLLLDTIVERIWLAAGSGGHRGADDAGVVEQRRGHDEGPDPGQPRHPLVRLLADAAAAHDEVRGEQGLDVVQVLVDPPGPLAPAQVVQFLGPLGRARLGVVTVDLDVPELGVRHQDALDEQRAADPRAEGQHQHGPLLADARAERHLGHPGRVRVVQDPDLVAGGLAEQRARVQPEPGRIQVGGGPGHPVGDHAGGGDAERA